MTKKVLHRSNKLVHGIGIKGMEYSTKVSGKKAREYGLWTDMLLRCTKNFQDKNLTYIGTTCSENFKSYTFFYEWCNKQVGFNSKDEKGKSWHLDKDLLVKDNKLYSEDTCVFVPLRLNILTTKRDKSRSNHSLGVYWDEARGKYVARCNIGGRNLKYLGGFDTADIAFNTYKIFKENLIKQIVESYKGQVDNRVYTSLSNYSVSISD